jgi:hypothetical protein
MATYTPTANDRVCILPVDVAMAILSTYGFPDEVDYRLATVELVGSSVKVTDSQYNDHRLVILSLDPH